MPNRDKVIEFEELVKPVIKYLCENWHPHAKIIITPTGAELVVGQMGTPEITEYLKD